MESDARESLKAYIERELLIKHAYRMDIVHKVSSRVRIVDLIEVALTCVGKWRVSHIVAECDRFDQIEIEVKRSADRSRDSRNKLNVQTAA